MKLSLKSMKKKSEQLKEKHVGYLFQVFTVDICVLQSVSLKK